MTNLDQKKQIKERVDEIIKEDLNLIDDIIVSDSEISSNYPADSLDLICILLDIENAFNIYVKYEDIDKLKTPQNIYDYVFEKISDKSDSENKNNEKTD